jgi:hypothetical protein
MVISNNGRFVKQSCDPEYVSDEKKRRRNATMMASAADSQKKWRPETDPGRHFR